MPPTPLISVCIPVYNGAQFIGNAIRSVLAQTVQDFELVVTDNRSTDGTLDLVHGIHDSRIRTSVNETNVGPVGNFNRCIQLATGRYLKILCADDLLYPECLARQSAVLDADQHGRIAMVGCHRDIIDDRGTVRIRSRGPSFSGTRSSADAIRYAVRSGTNPYGEPMAMLMRTDYARRTGGFREQFHYCLDLDFWLRLLACGGLHVLPDALCAFRVTPGAWSSQLAGRQAVEYRDFIASLQGISSWDQLLGTQMARWNQACRKLFYWWLSHVRKHGG